MRLGTSALLAAPWLVSGIAAAASSPCVDRTAAESFDGNRVVLVGKVTKRTPVDADGRPVPSSEAVRGLYRVEVVEEFKGESRSEYDMLADLPLPPPQPGEVYVNEPFVLEIGRKYLLFGWNEPLRVDPCASVVYEEGAEALQAVRKARKASR